MSFDDLKQQALQRFLDETPRRDLVSASQCYGKFRKLFNVTFDDYKLAHNRYRNELHESISNKPHKVN